jgi:uncharacterized protein VirK/YbjX
MQFKSSEKAQQPWRQDIGKRRQVVSKESILSDWIQCASYFWIQLRQTPFSDTICYALLFFRHLPSVLKLLMVRYGNSDALIKVRPEILEFIHVPYLAANWSVQDRVNRIVDHCRTVNRISGIVDFTPDRVIDVLRLHPIDLQYRITLDQARWLLPDGQLVISLWHGVDRLYSLSFCLSSQGDGLKAYVGGIQGRAGPGVLDRYRRFTKQSFGMRPRDFLIEVFKSFCRAMNVTAIRAVSDENHRFTRSALNASTDTSQIKVDYDKIWMERGGSYGGDGFFILSLDMYRRPPEKIPVRKRAMYRKRYTMMALVDEQLTSALKGQHPD